MLITDKTGFFKNLLLALAIGFSFGLSVSCQTKPQTAEEIVKVCQAFLNKDDLQGASQCVEKAMFANPTLAQEISQASTSAIFQKCVALKEKEYYKNSIICFEGVTELMPNSANVQFNLADSYYEYFKENSYKDAEILARAEESVKKGLQIKNDDIAAIILYGEILQSFGKLKEAKEQYKKLIEFDSKTSLYWINLGLVQQKLNEDVDAIKSLEQAAVLDPNNYLSFSFLAISYKKIGKTDKVIEALEKVLQIEPDNEEAKTELNKLKEKREFEKTKKAKSKTAVN